MKRNRKGVSTVMAVVIGLVGFMLLGGMVGGALLYAQGSIAGGGDQPTDQVDDEPDQSSTAPYDGRDVKLNVVLENLSSEKVKTGKLHIWESKPDAWEDENTISNAYGSGDGYDKVSVESDGITTIQKTPGTYYVSAEVSSDYPAFFKITIPDGTGQFEGTKLSDYNSNPLSKTVTSADVYSLGSKSYDLGISSNTTTNTEYVAHNTYRPSDNTEYHGDYVLIEPGSNNGGVDPTTDSNGDLTYDEGITKSWLEVSGAVDQDTTKSEVFFQPGSGIDELAGDDRARIDISGLNFDGDHSMDVAFGIEATESGDGSAASDGDEVASDGERFWDIKFVDSAGNVNSVAGVTG
jgi:hypothetical protein